MIYIHDYNTTDFSGGCECVLDKLANVTVTHNLQQPHTLSFDCPNDEKAGYVRENNIAVIEGQAYRINSVTKNDNKRLSVLHVEAQRLFFADSVRKHIRNMPDLMGYDPYDVIEAAFADTRFHLLTNAELSTLGMERIGTDGTQIDFFSIDKTNPYAVCEAVIEAYGKGEIYVDNWNVAVVERIGTDNGVRLTLDKNLETLSIQKQTTELCTVLYPYGKDDLTVDQAEIQEEGQPTQYYGLPYVVSAEGVSRYGVIEGYKDYSEYDDPTKLLAAAIWDLMGEGNEYRLDTPQLTITGDMVDLSKLSDYGDFEKIELGDTVHVYDESGNKYDKRIINITYYPFTSQPPKVTIGSPSNTNLFYTQWQQQKLWKTLQKNSTTGTSKIIASYFNGTTSASPIKSADGNFTLDNALITIKDTESHTRAVLGLVGNSFTFSINKADGISVLHTNTDGSMSAIFSALTALVADITTANVTTLNIGNVDVGEKLIDLQDQIDELKEGGTNE